MDRVEAILGRSQFDVRLDEALRRLSGERILVTGANGSIGRTLEAVLSPHCDVFVTDMHEMDVTDPGKCLQVLAKTRPGVVFHLAGMKHAPLGEEDPDEAVEVNFRGTRNVLWAADRVLSLPRVVLSSTCKACDPETAYGATKLLAERVTMNAGQTVARFHNVIETSGNVFELWEAQDVKRVAPCERYFISIREAVGLLLWSATLPPARYGLRVGPRRNMFDVAAALYPEMDFVTIPPRRGDRLREPLCAAGERFEDLGHFGGLARIVSPHDPQERDDLAGDDLRESEDRALEAV